MMSKIFRWSENKTKIHEIVDRRIEKITNLDKNINSDDLIYRYKGNTANAKLDGFDNALNIINKIQNGEISLSDVENIQEKFKSYLKKMKKGNKSINQRSTLLKCFTKQEMKLFNFIMIIL